ncbi:MAG: nickel transporter [Betaproteobacteria bacterium]|nr:nickel transporter [Betaproteobacteria bacterium]
MPDLPQDWIGLMLLVFVLGMRHGLDADHLVAIDGLTRFNAGANPRLARRCGALFSLGHGIVVMLVAVTVALFAQHFTLPPWLAHLCVWLSITFLLALGMLNMLAVATADPGQPVRLAGIRARLVARIECASHPLLVAAVGSLFALSFDTLSQAALFAVTAAQFGGVAHALILGALFTLGMVCVDVCNGLWIFRLIGSTSRRALIASRVFAVVISCLSLTVALFGIARYFSPTVSAWSENKDLALGLAVVVLVLLGFVLAMSLAKIKAADANY